MTTNWEMAVMRARAEAFRAILETKRSKGYSKGQEGEARREADLQHLRGWRDCTEWILQEMKNDK